MADASDSRRLATLARNAAISISVGVAFVFLVLFTRRELWGWRLALWGGLGGLLTYSCCHFLDATVGDRIRRRQLLPARLVGVPLYFLGGCFGELAATALLKALGLLPFTMSGRDLRISLLIGGGVSIVIGLLFYSFRLLRRRLQESIERIKEQEFAEKELSLARLIQRRLLPPQELDGEGYRIAARNLPARFVAGDFYDVFPLSDGALGLAVVLHAQNIDEQYLLGAEGSMAIELDLPNGLSIEIQATPVRYQKLDEGYLIGARISEMTARDRELYLEYLGELAAG